MKQLEALGWNSLQTDTWSSIESDSYVPGRIVADFGSLYTVATPERYSALLAGALAHKLVATAMPKIGDWVALDISNPEQAVIQAVLPRSSELVRGQVGRMVDKQVVAANIDIAFIVQPLDHDFNVARLERYIFQLSLQSITPIILLNKTDKVKDVSWYQREVEGIGAAVIAISAVHDSDLSAVEEHILPGKTAVILGSSGAGKSTLTNRLLGEERQATQEIRDRDSKGRHTTVHRELFILPGGGIVIDTPGIRELQLWGTIDDLEATFADITTAIRQCHFPNCQHDTEVRCGIKQGLEDGTIDAKRYKIYCNFKQELEMLDARRGFIEERRTQQSKESAKRLRRRQERNAESVRYDDDVIY